MATTIETATDAYATMSARLDFDAKWMEHIDRVVVDGRLDNFTVMSLHLSPAAARELASQLLAAVEESER